MVPEPGDLVLFRRRSAEVPAESGGHPVSHQIIPRSRRLCPRRSENGLVGWRQGKVQRMTKKNGLPCDSVISFIEDKEKRWWLYTDCGVVEFPDSELSDGGPTRKQWFKPMSMIVLDGARPRPRPLSIQQLISPDGRVWFATGLVVQMVDPSRLSQKALPAETYIESVVVDRKEFARREP